MVRILKFCNRCQKMKFSRVCCTRLFSVFSMNCKMFNRNSFPHLPNRTFLCNSSNGFFNSKNDVLYEGHIPTSTFQKLMLTAGSGLVALFNPWRDDMIATMGETSGYFALKYMYKRMSENQTGRQILREKPLINTKTVDFDALRNLEENTFGKHYVNWLDKHKCDPDARRQVQFVDDIELAYVMLRYRQCHDLFHTVMGMPTNMLGEVAVKWIEGIQFGLPMCVSGAILAPIRFGPVYRRRYISKILPWSIRVGRNAEFLMNVYWEKHWSTDLSELRKQFNIEPPPKFR